MTPLRQAVDDYLSLRRGLGFKLLRHESYLREFVSFLKEKGASRITTQLAVAVRHATPASVTGGVGRHDSHHSPVRTLPQRYGSRD